MVRAVRSQRQSMFNAPPCSAPDRRRWAARLTDVRGQGGTVHGSHQDIPGNEMEKNCFITKVFLRLAGASGEAESPPRGFCGVLLPEGNSAVYNW